MRFTTLILIALSTFVIVPTAADYFVPGPNPMYTVSIRVYGLTLYEDGDDPWASPGELYATYNDSTTDIWDLDDNNGAGRTRFFTGGESPFVTFDYIVPRFDKIVITVWDADPGEDDVLIKITVIIMGHEIENGRADTSGMLVGKSQFDSEGTIYYTLNAAKANDIGYLNIMYIEYSITKMKAP